MTQQQYIDALNQQQAQASGNGHALKNSKRNLVPKKTIGGNGNAMRFRRQLITKGGNKSSNGNNQSGSQNNSGGHGPRDNSVGQRDKRVLSNGPGAPQNLQLNSNTGQPYRMQMHNQTLSPKNIKNPR